MQLSGRTTSSWNNIMLNDRFTHFPTQSPIGEAVPKTRTEIAPTPIPKAKIKSKSPYSVLMTQVRTANAKAAAVRKNKK